ncbi:putative Short chain dehydrogenase [Seiridium cardinale]|uniref:Short chain dehydrogenase n=1 Tax=Seiridium cardinale TaxID=138064 RepID=A0ABR2XQX5_9PEZI
MTQNKKSMLVTVHSGSLKGSISVIQSDVVDQKPIEAAREQIQAQFGKLDVLINNTGIIVYQPAVIISALRQSFEANVFGQILVTETLEPLLKKSRTPYVIYVSSETGSITTRLDPTFKYDKLRDVPYHMSKSALNMLAAYHRHNYGEWYKVLAYNPG